MELESKSYHVRDEHGMACGIVERSTTWPEITWFAVIPQKGTCEVGFRTPEEALEWIEEQWGK